MNTHWWSHTYPSAAFTERRFFVFEGNQLLLPTSLLPCALRRQCDHSFEIFRFISCEDFFSSSSSFFRRQLPASVTQSLLRELKNKRIAPLYLLFFSLLLLSPFLIYCFVSVHLGFDRSRRWKQTPRNHWQRQMAIRRSISKAIHRKRPATVESFGAVLIWSTWNINIFVIKVSNELICIVLGNARWSSIDWKDAFCSSSFEVINRYPHSFLLYRTVLIVLTVASLIYGMANTHPIYEWLIYYTHLTLLVTFLAVVFQFLVTSRIQFYRGDNIVPRPTLQYIHMILIIVALGSGLIVSLVYWTFIFRPVPSALLPKVIFEHGVIWFLLLIDIVFFTRLPIYMIDCIPLMIFVFLYVLFTISIYLFQCTFSRNRVGLVYRAFDFNQSPIRVGISAFVSVFILPFAVPFFLWNIFRVRRAIQVKILNDKEDSDTTIDLWIEQVVQRRPYSMCELSACRRTTNSSSLIINKYFKYITNNLTIRSNRLLEPETSIRVIVEALFHDFI